MNDSDRLGELQWCAETLVAITEDVMADPVLLGHIGRIQAWAIQDIQARAKAALQPAAPTVQA